MKKKFVCIIDCANCASKMEEAVSKLEDVKNVNINYMTQKLTLEADDNKFDKVLETAIKVMKKIDDDVEVIV